MEPLEVLEKVNSFYDAAWNKLIYAAGAIAAVVVIIVPLIVQYLQNRSLRLQEKEIMLDIDRRLEELKLSLIKEIRNEFSAEVNKLREAFHIEVEKLNHEIDRSIDISRARTLHLEAQSWLRSKDYFRASSSYLRCLRLYIKCEEYESAEKVMKGLNKTFLPELTKDEVSKIFNDQDRSQENYIEELLNNAPDHLKRKIKKIDRTINQLP